MENYTEVKNAITDLKNDFDFDSSELKEINENILNEETDFQVGDYRFICYDEIDKIQQEELSSDTYILGCFNADFLADIINIPYKAIIALQEAGCYSELGEICLDYLEEIQEEYSRLDGYGHHFAHYDHNTNEIVLNNTRFYIFKID